jgi:DNA repair exonuclease SbcCD ATPase subunit
MQNTFEQLTEILERLELISQGNLSLPDIEKDIVLEKMRKIYAAIQSGKAPKAQPEVAATPEKYEVYQGLEEDVDLFFDTEHESYTAFDQVAQKDVSKQQEEQKRIAEEQRRKEAEQKRLAEEQRRKEEEAKRLAEEQRRKEEEQKRLAEEQRRKEEEAKRLAEEQRRKEEEQKRLAEEQRRKEEEQKRLAEEQRRKEEEQKRLAEEQRRKEEEAKRLAEEQRRKEEEQKRLAEEQRRKEEEAKRLAEEQRRKEEERKKQNAPSDEDDLLQFIPKPQTVKPGTSQRSLNDLFTEKDGDHSLGAQFQNAKVHDLTKAISINDKFTYIKELFNNKGEEFSAAITSLNQCRNMEEAFNCLEGLKQKYFWDSTSTTYLSLCDLLRRKFN